MAVKIRLPNKQTLSDFPIDVKDADLYAHWSESPESQELEAGVYAVFTGVTGRKVNHLTIYTLPEKITEPSGTLTGKVFPSVPPAELPVQQGELVVQSEWLLVGPGGHLRLTYRPKPT